MNKVLNIAILSVVLQASVCASQSNLQLTPSATALGNAGIIPPDPKGCAELGSLAPGGNNDTEYDFVDSSSVTTMLREQQNEETQDRAADLDASATQQTSPNALARSVQPNTLGDASEAQATSQNGWSLLSVLGTVVTTPFRFVGSLFARSDRAATATVDTAGSSTAGTTAANDEGSSVLQDAVSASAEIQGEQETK